MTDLAYREETEGRDLRLFLVGLQLPILSAFVVKEINVRCALLKKKINLSFENHYIPLGQRTFEIMTT